MPIRFLLISGLALASSLYAAAPFAAAIQANLPSPQPVGVSIGLFAGIQGPGRAIAAYRFSVSDDGGPFHIIRDFSQSSSFIWTPELYEHQSVVRVTARRAGAKETADSDLPFRIISRIHDGAAVITPGSNPLVALFSSPACPAGQQFRIAFQKTGEAVASHTNLQSCRGALSNNVFVAGMLADRSYRMRVEAEGAAPGEWLTFHTGMLDGFFPPVSLTQARAKGTVAANPLTVYDTLEPWRPMAADQDGNIMWYLQGPTFLTRLIGNGHILALPDGDNSSNNMKRLQLLRELDLAGNTLRETNITRVAEQLESYGIKSSCKAGSEECVPSFHHEAIRLPNGHTVVIAGLERMFPAGTQGSKDRVDVLGDLIIDLDEDFQVAWVWNSFDHVDIRRASVNDEKCAQGAGNAGCTPVFLASTANGWLHSNSLNYIPASGDLLLSMPEQDMVLKIDYQSGKGTGKVLWRLGMDGDFKVISSDPDPWFSYQHDVGFEPAGSNMITLMDDGSRRKKKSPAANNRGQIWKIDEEAKTATLVKNADLGIYSMAVGSAQTLPDGGFSFESGIVMGPGGLSSRATEVGPDGAIAYSQQIAGAIVYRSFRVRDLYTPLAK